LEFDFGDDKKGEESGEIIDFSAQESLGKCPKCGAGAANAAGGMVFELGKNYVCDKSVPTLAQPTPSCDFKTGQIILQQPIERTQMVKLLETGKTDLLDKFVSMRTRRAFKAMLTWDAEAGKVNFEFAPSKFPPRKTAPKFAAKTSNAIKTAVRAASTGAAAKKVPIKKAAATAKTGATAKVAKPKVQRQTTAASGKLPSTALAAIIGAEPVARTEVIKKLWDYIKANGLQDATNKRAINADAKLLSVFGKPQVTMFELAGIVGKHLS
jgi:DNA topoisomerase-3